MAGSFFSFFSSKYVRTNYVMITRKRKGIKIIDEAGERGDGNEKNFDEGQFEKKKLVAVKNIMG